MRDARMSNAVHNLPPMEPSPLEKAFSDYNRMAAEVESVRAHNQHLISENAKLASEVSMLREMLKISDTDRIRLQGVSSTLMGQLMSINAVIGDAVRLSIKHGVEAVQQAEGEDQELEEAGKAVQDVIQRVQPVAATEPPARLQAPVRAPQAVVGGLPVVDFRR